MKFFFYINNIIYFSSRSIRSSDLFKSGCRPWESKESAVQNTVCNVEGFQTV